VLRDKWIGGEIRRNCNRKNQVQKIDVGHNQETTRRQILTARSFSEVSSRTSIFSNKVAKKGEVNRNNHYVLTRGKPIPVGSKPR
jgi:hypothetical protein